VNRSRIKVRLTGADRRAIADHIVFKLYNQRVSSFNLLFDTEIKHGAVTLSNVPAAPDGLAELFIRPDRYRFKRLFVDVPSENPALVEETLFVDPDEVAPEFPTWTVLQSESRWSDLRRLLKASDFTSAASWKELDDLPKAGLLNIHAKMQKDARDGRPALLPFLQRVRSRADFRPERIFATVEPALLSVLSGNPAAYKVVDGALHPFDPPWKPIRPNGSFKTRDPAGNLQVTLARHPDGRMLADIDLDDHQGIAHVADVLRHAITDKDTHPYDIHDILVYFQRCDPGYTLA